MRSARLGAPIGKIGLRETIAIGVGGMVGGGIFSVLGLAVQVAGTGAYASFGIAGIATLLTGYSYAKLSVRYPERGGTVTFLNQAFRGRFLPGSLSVLLWLAYFVMLALYAYAFGSYLAALVGAPERGLLSHLLSSAAIVGFTALNLTAAETIARAQSLLVYATIAILLFFIAVGLAFVGGAGVSPAGFPCLEAIVFAGSLIFLAYEGFELIANAADDVRDPMSTLPRAFYGCILLVGVLYVLAAFVAIGNLSPEAIVAERDYALAVAARQFLGPIGFGMIGVAAVLSTGGAINATFFGSARFTQTLGTSGELPHWFAENIWHRPIVGLLATAAATLVIANALNLEGISTAGSGMFLIVFAATNYAGFRLAAETGASRLLSLLGVLTCLGCLAALVYYAATSFPTQLLAFGALFLLAVCVEAAEIAANRQGFKGVEKSRGVSL